MYYVYNKCKINLNHLAEIEETILETYYKFNNYIMFFNLKFQFVQSLQK